MDIDIQNNYEVNHTKMLAPFVRLISKNGNVYKYDLRISQPNVGFMSSDVLHSLEHMLNVEFELQVKSKWICAAPYGCSTGLWMICELAPEDFSELLFKVLNNLLEYTEVPLCNKTSCGNYRNHSLQGAHDAITFLLINKSKLNKVFN